MAWWVPIKASLGKALLLTALLKGAHHKYVKRVPIPGKLTKTGKQRYRYFYKLTGTKGGGGVGNHEHFVVGASMRGTHEGKVGHFEIKGLHDDGRVTITHDESGKTETLHRDELVSRLHAEHENAIADEHAEAGKEREAKKAKALGELAEARKHGASEKTIEAAKKRAKALGATDDEVVSEGERAVKAKEAEGAKASSESRPKPVKTKTVRFKNSTLEPGEFYKDRDGLWVSVESKVKRMSARDREFEEDAGDPHFADAHSVGTVKLRPATADEKAAFDAWEQEVNAIADAKKLPENIKGWKDIEVSDETRRSAIPAIRLIKDGVDRYKANQELFDRVTAAGYEKMTDDDLAELAKIELARMDAKLPSEEGYWKSSLERGRADLAAAIADPSKLRKAHGSNLLYYAKQAKENAQKHDSERLSQAVEGDAKAIAEVVKDHGVDIGGGASAEAARWKAPSGAERIDPPESAAAGGVTIYVDREGGKVYSHQRAGYDDYRNIVKVADLTPENESAIARAKEVQGKKASPRPVVDVPAPKGEKTQESTAAPKASTSQPAAPSKPAAPAPAKSSGPKLQYRQTRDAGWAVFGPASHVTAGKAHTVHKKDGSTKTEYVHRVSKPFNVDGVPHVYGFLSKGSTPENEPPLRTFARLALKRLRKAKAHAAS